MAHINRELKLPYRAERFLKDLANLLVDDEAAVTEFIARHADFLPTAEMRRPLESALHEILEAKGEELPEELRARLFDLREQLPGLRRRLRALWTAPDDWTRLWLVFRLNQDVMHGGDHALLLTSDPPPLTLFMQALLYFLRQADRARRCANPDCPAPYFFAKHRAQKFCTEDCALPAQREWKRRWWGNHGREWVRKRAKGPARKKNRPGRNR